MWWWMLGDLRATWSFVWVGWGELRMWLLSHWLAFILPKRILPFFSVLLTARLAIKQIKVKEYFRGSVVILSSKFSNWIRHKKQRECFLTCRFCSPLPPEIPIRQVQGGAWVEPCWVWGQRPTHHTLWNGVCVREIQYHINYVCNAVTFWFNIYSYILVPPIEIDKRLVQKVDIYLYKFMYQL